MQRYSSKGSSYLGEKEEKAASLAAGLVLPHVSVKSGSSIVDRETTAAQNLAGAQVSAALHFTLSFVQNHASPSASAKGSSTHSRQMQTSTQSLTFS